MRNSRVNSITYGALLSALLGVLLFVNRQLAGMLDTYMFWIVPLPVIVYCLKFGVKQSLVMGTSMVLLSFIIATPVTTFYVVGSVIAGIVYGDGVLKQRNTFQLILSVIVISLIVMFVSTFALAGVFGYDLSSDLAYMKELMVTMLGSLGESDAASELIKQLTSTRFLLSVLVIASVLTSVLEGILVHLLAFLVLKKLKMQLPPMVPLGEIKAPLVIKLFCFGVMVANLMAGITSVTQYNDIILPLLTIVYVFCMFYGYLLVVVFLAGRFPSPKSRALLVIPIIFTMLMMPVLTMVLGFLDMFTGIRDRIIREIKLNGKQY